MARSARPNAGVLALASTRSILASPPTPRGESRQETLGAVVALHGQDYEHAKNLVSSHALAHRIVKLLGQAKDVPTPVVYEAFTGQAVDEAIELLVTHVVIDRHLTLGARIMPVTYALSPRGRKILAELESTAGEEGDQTAPPTSLMDKPE